MGLKTDFKTIDYESIVQEMKHSLLEKWKSIDFHVDDLLESDPATKIIEIAAYQELYVRQSIKESMGKVFVESAQGKDLDNLARLFNFERKSGEDDFKFRKRIIAPRYSEYSAGTQAAYEKCVLSHPCVKDAKAISKADSEIDLIFLFQSQKGWSGSIIEELRNNLEEKRIITDCIILIPANTHSYELSVDLHLRPGPGVSEVLS